MGAGDYIDFLHQLSRKVTAEEDNKPVPFTPQVQKLIRYGPNPVMILSTARENYFTNVGSSLRRFRPLSADPKSDF